MENKDIKKIGRPTPLRSRLLDMLPNSTLSVYTSAYKVPVVRVMCSKLNRKFGKKVFVVTDNGLTNYCKVTRLR